MVKINKKDGGMAKDGTFSPVMWRHVLDVIATIGPFVEGERVTCYVAEYNDNRFAVWDVDFRHHNKYKVFSENELHATFNEV